MAYTTAGLAGDPSDPFPPFKALLDTYFPGTATIPGANPDNPFPFGLFRRLPQRVDNQFGLAGDFDKDGAGEVFGSSPWGVGVLKLAGNTMDALMLHGLGKVSATRMPASFGQTVQITADGASRQISVAHAALSAVTHCATIGHQ